MADVVVGRLQICVGWLGCLHINSTRFRQLIFLLILFTILPLFDVVSVGDFLDVCPQMDFFACHVSDVQGLVVVFAFLHFTR